MNKLQLTLKDDLSKELLIEFLKEKYDVSVEESTVDLQKYDVDNSKILKKKQPLVLQYIADGYKYTEIAKTMGMTVDGVRFYVKAIYKKLGVNNAILAIKEYQKQRV